MAELIGGYILVIQQDGEMATRDSSITAYLVLGALKEIFIQLAMKGKNRAKSFSWRKMTEKTLRLYETVGML